mmetsp:Transcript_35202/g.85283  ORF Transcript_35202/g.85283 Transcript_35202/m.85283 type:complete len:315 (-) Transcript_35202:1446-2390(-)
MSAATVLITTCCFKKKCLQKHNKDPGLGLVKCANLKCKKSFHTSCSQTNVLTKHSLKPIKNRDGDTFWACTKTCYTVIQSSKSSSRIPWDKDGPNGPEDDQVNSERILLEWLLTDSNYSKYRGNGNYGTSKTQFCKQIANLIQSKGVVVERTDTQVRDKICGLERSFKAARDFMYRETGVGLKATDEGTFQDLIRKKCKHYYELEPIFIDRVGVAPETNESMPNDGFGLSDDSSSIEIIDRPEGAEPATERLDIGDALLRLHNDGDHLSIGTGSLATQEPFIEIDYRYLCDGRLVLNVIYACCVLTFLVSFSQC